MDIVPSRASRASYAVESRFIGQFAWFLDFRDASAFLESLGTSRQENHWKIVELSDDTL